MLHSMLEIHFEDLPEVLREELINWIDCHYAKASKYLSLASNYSMKQQFKFSDSLNFHITEQIFHEAMLVLGYEFKSCGEGKFQYKARRI